MTSDRTISATLIDMTRSRLSCSIVRRIDPRTGRLACRRCSNRGLGPHPSRTCSLSLRATAAPCPAIMRRHDGCRTVWACPLGTAPAQHRWRRHSGRLSPKLAFSRVLGPAGFDDGLSAALTSPDGRYSGMLHASSPAATISTAMTVDWSPNCAAPQRHDRQPPQWADPASRGHGVVRSQRRNRAISHQIAGRPQRIAPPGRCLPRSGSPRCASWPPTTPSGIACN